MVTQNAKAAAPGTAAQDASATGPELPSRRVTERPAGSLPGLPMLVLNIVALLAGVGVFVLSSHEHGAVKAVLITLGVLLLIGNAFILPGLFAVVPGQALCGAAVRRVPRHHPRPGPAPGEPVHPPHRGLHPDPQRGVGPGQGERRDGNPVEIAAVVVWRVQDTASAGYSVDSFSSTSPCRARPPSVTWPPATPTTTGASGEVTLRDGAKRSRAASPELAAGGAGRRAGRGGPPDPSVVRARDRAGHAAPPAGEAIVAARQRIVQGAVGMVEMALERPRSRCRRTGRGAQGRHGDNLLVPVRRAGTHQVVNTGTLYQ